MAANFREACRSRSPAEFISKLAQAKQKADESQLWWEILMEGCGIMSDEITRLHKEADELTAIIVAMSKKTKNSRIYGSHRNRHQEE